MIGVNLTKFVMVNNCGICMIHSANDIKKYMQVYVKNTYHNYLLQNSHLENRSNLKGW